MNKGLVQNISVADLTPLETVDFICDGIKAGRRIHQVAVNAFILVMAKKNKALRESIVEADLINADGQSVVWASKFLGTPLRERVTGIDLMESLVARAHMEGYKIYLLGAEEKIVSRVANIYTEKYGSSILAGYRNGYFTEQEEPAIVENVASSGAHMLFVAMGSPRKEILLYKYRDQLKVPYMMGVGGTFDVIAGKVKRAPQWMQNNGLEWFYRIVQEPGRMWKRYLVTNTLFICYILVEKVRMFGRSSVQN